MRPVTGTPPDAPSHENRIHPIPLKAGIPGDIPWWVPAAVLAILVLSVYWQVGGYPFVNLDDDVYVFENPAVLRGLTLEGVSWAFTTFHTGNWHPLTWLSHMLDAELFGPSAGWHHRVNVLLHLLNTELLFLVLWRMTGGLWQSAFVAALFGVHPLHVESVVWVAERKDVLCALFWILAMGAYLRYVRRPGPGRYLLLTTVFALGLMCKPMLVTLPFVLFLLDWWPLGRLAVPALPRLVREKVPLLGLSAMSCAITYLAQAGGGAVAPTEYVPLGSRISNALVSYVAYLGKTAWPSQLAVYYPHPSVAGATIPALHIAGAALVLGSASLLAIRKGSRYPCLPVGWLWYLGTLVPVIGIVQVGAQGHADRYTYLPLVGIFLAAAWGIPEVSRGWRFRRAALGAFAGASLVALSMAAWSQAGYWRDSVTLLSRTVSVTDRNWIAWNNLGFSYDRLGLYRQAVDCYREALRIKPDYARGWNNLGVSYGKLGLYRQAVGCFGEVLRLMPDNAEAWNNLGVAYGNLGRHQQAIVYFGEALRIRPDYAEAWNNLGYSYYTLQQYGQAIVNFREALRIRPDFTEARNNLVAADGNLSRSR